MKKWLFIIAGILIVFVGYGVIEYATEETVQIKNQKTLITQNVDNFYANEVDYTSEKTIANMNGQNNIFYDIKEYYRADEEVYHYVMDIESREESPMDVEDAPNYAILSLSVGAKEDAGKYRYSASSQPLIDNTINQIETGAYYLFSSDEPISVDEFRLQMIFTNKEAYINTDGTEVNEHSETFRYVEDYGEGYSILSN